MLTPEQREVIEQVKRSVALKPPPAPVGDPHDVEGALRRIAEAGGPMPLLTPEEFSAYVSTCLRCRQPFHEHLGVHGVDCKGEFPAVEYHEDGCVFSEGGGQLIAIRPPLPMPAPWPWWKTWLGKVLFTLRGLRWSVLHPVQFSTMFVGHVRRVLSSDLYAACSERMALQHAEMVRTKVLEMSVPSLLFVAFSIALINLPFRILTALGFGGVSERMVKWINHDEE